jgi:outer membrane receptor protein involved in Fe transport
LALVVAAAPAAAQAQTRAFDIPAQSLSSAVLEFSRQADVMVVLPPELAAGKRSAAVKGSLSVNAAIAQLLRRTGLRAMPNAAGGYRVAPFAEGRGAARAERSTASSGDDGGSFGDIIVTAQKREQRLIDVPQSISVLNAANLARSGATQFRDFANTVPGLSFSSLGAGYNQISLRGVTVGADIGSTVGVYVDEVPYGTSGPFADGPNNTLDVGLFDLNRIEVLRGPQGTLYGASTMGGLIKYVAAEPDPRKLSGQARAGLSTTRYGGISYDGSAAVNLPLATDRAAVRASAFYSRDGGYIDNLGTGEKDVNRSKVYGGRLDLLLKATERLEIRLTGFAQNIERNGEATADFTFSGEPLFGSLLQNRVLPERYRQRFRLVSSTIKYDAGFADLTSVTSYQTTRMHYVADVTPFYAGFLNSLPGLGPFGAVGVRYAPRTNKFTQELRLSGKLNDILDWQLGGFYTDEDSKYQQEFVLRNLQLQPVPNNVFTYLIPTEYLEKAVFGNLTWHVTEKLALSGGARYAHNSQTYEQVGSGAFGANSPQRKSSDGVVTYLANAQYKFSNNAAVYARYATGYRPGGPNFILNNPTTGLPSGPTSFRPDSLKSYEFGIKADTADRTFGVEAALYQIDWDDIQITNVTDIGFAGKTNAPGGARIRGGELALNARPSRSLTFTGAFAYISAKLLEANADLGARKGERLPNVPKFTASINADYVAVDHDLRPTFGATLRFVSDRMSSFDGNFTYRQFRLPDYKSVDLRAGLTAFGVETRVFVRNLFDERGLISASNFRGVAQPSILQPRTIGMSATVRY